MYKETAIQEMTNSNDADWSDGKVGIQWVDQILQAGTNKVANAEADRRRAYYAEREVALEKRAIERAAQALLRDTDVKNDNELDDDDTTKKIVNVLIGICCLFIVLLLMMIITQYVTGGGKESQDTVNKCLESKKNECEAAVVEEWKTKKINKSSAWFKTYGKWVTLPVKLVLVVLLLVIVIFIMKGKRNKTSRRRRTEYIALFVVASAASIEGLMEIAIPPFVDYKFKNELAKNRANCSNRMDLCDDEIKDHQAQIDKKNQTNTVNAVLIIFLVIMIVFAVYWDTPDTPA